MPSFDIVSEVEVPELNNSVDQSNREVQTRFDFKGVDAKFSFSDSAITMQAEVEFQLEQMLDILRKKLVKRDVDTRCLKIQDPVMSGKQAKQIINVQQGIEKDIAKKIIKEIKGSKFKVSASIMEDKLRVTGKKLDDLQQIISLLKSKDYPLPLQFNNFRS